MHYNEHFFKRANGRRRSRLFEQRHFDRHCEALSDAFRAADANEPYFWEQNGGTVGLSYVQQFGEVQTARSGVYVDPKTRDIIEFVDAVQTIAGRCPSIWTGESAYQDDWNAYTQMRPKKEAWRAW